VLKALSTVSNIAAFETESAKPAEGPSGGACITNTTAFGRVSEPTPETVTVATTPGLTKKPPGAGITVITPVVSPKAVMVIRSFVKAVLLSVPLPVAVSVYSMGEAAAGAANPRANVVVATAANAKTRERAFEMSAMIFLRRSVWKPKA
jgi:hypothetical protein